MSDRPTLSIIVVSYNTCDVTLECIRSVERETSETDYELLVIDNDSDDGSAEAIGAEFPDAQLLAMDENLGFGRANNLAATKAHGDYILLLNPDTVILDGAIDRLMHFARQFPEARIWGGRTLFPDRSLNPTSCWRGMSLWGLFCWASGLARVAPESSLFNYNAYGGWKRDTVRQVDTITGCFLLIGRQDWEDLRGFDPTFFMYGEESDLCLRARQRGATPMLTPEAQIIHYGGLSETVRAAKIQSLLLANVTFAMKHWGWIRGWLCRLLLRLMVAIRMIGYYTQARMFGHKSSRDKAATWKQVWQARSSWLKGYS